MKIHQHYNRAFESQSQLHFDRELEPKLGPFVETSAQLGPNTDPTWTQPERLKRCFFMGTYFIIFPRYFQFVDLDVGWYWAMLPMLGLRWAQSGP